MIAIPTEKPKKPTRDFREELIVEVMEATGMSREEAERQYDACN